MAIDVNSTNISSPAGTDILISAGSGNRLLYQNPNGYIAMSRNSSGNVNTPLFVVGAPNQGWTYIAGTIPFNYTGNYYDNVNGCYNLSNYRFTCTQRGFHLMRYHTYIYGALPANSTNYTWYCHPNYTINGSFSTRRAGGSVYRMRLYGLWSGYGQDTDNCELMYLYPGDYVEAYIAPSGTVEHHLSYCSFAGFYIGDIQ